MLTTESVRQLICSLAHNLDILDDAIKLQFIGFQLFLCIAVGKVEDAVYSLDDALQAFAVSTFSLINQFPFLVYTFSYSRT